MSSPELYRELAAALRNRRAIIADRDAYERDAAAHLAMLQSASERIETLRARLPSPLDPQLKHFLERASYDKALAFLEAAQGN